MKLTKKLLLPLLCSTLLSNQVLAKQQAIDKIEAVVNQEVILSSDLNRMLLDVKTRYKENEQGLPPEKALKKQILDKLITDRLQLQSAERIGLYIKDAQVDQAIQQLAEDKNLSLQEFQNHTEQQGLNYAAFKDNIRNEITINEIRQIQVRRRVNISDQEVEKMVERINQEGQATTKFNFAHILLKFNNDGNIEEQQRIQKQADDIVKKIRSGEDITELAIIHSQGPRALEGGNWGWRTIDEIPTLFVDAFDDQKTQKNDVIGPFRTNLGLHIIKILDKEGSQSVMAVEVNVRHILIKSNIILSDTKAKQLLQGYRQDIIDGKEEFSDLALEYSQDVGSAVRGGELGWADPSIYVPEFKELSLSQPIGKISEPFNTMHGWHILEVLGKRESDITEQATKQRAYGILFQQQFQSEVYAWMNEIRQEAYIKINNPDYVLESETTQ
jgi:peptidyl-prolyl cis-trans isomerase SurA